jgi:hypothetical protein
MLGKTEGVLGITTTKLWLYTEHEFGFRCLVMEVANDLMIIARAAFMLYLIHQQVPIHWKHTNPINKFNHLKTPRTFIFKAFQALVFGLI